MSNADTFLSMPGLLGISASNAAQRIDTLFLAMLGISSVAAVGVCLAIVILAVRYRQGSKVERGVVEKRPGIEITWTVLPLILFFGVFVWAAWTFTQLYKPATDALPVYVVAKQWMWKLQHGNGRREINELHVPMGQPVRLVMTSEDAIHSFFVPAFRIKQDVLPGRYTELWFNASKIGEFSLFCAEYCGSEHSQMVGRIVVMTPADYSRWVGDGVAQPSLAQYGFARFRELGCAGCHAAASTVPAPSLAGLLGRTIHLQDGRTLVADDNYVRDSILLPNKDVVAGYKPLMPSFAGQVSEEDIQALIAYLRTGEGP